MQRIIILGVPIDYISFQDAIRQIGGYFRSEGQFHIATPNPEMLVEAQKHDVFRAVLNQTSLNLPDGTGLVWAMKKIGRLECFVCAQHRGWKVKNTKPSNLQTLKPSFERVTGTDTMTYLCSPAPRICPPERIFLLGAAEGIAEKAAEILKYKNHLLKEIGTFAGSPKIDDEDDIIKRINAFSPTLLFVAFGAPAQDLWIARNLKKMPSVKVAMGVGGAFDFIVGKQKRAPKFLQKIGLEWFWRLVLEPKRIKRIWRAVVVFPWMILRGKNL